MKNKEKHIENKEKAQELFLRCYKHTGDINLSLKITQRKRRCFDTWKQKEPNFEYKFLLTTFELADQLENKLINIALGGNLKAIIFFLERMSPYRWGKKDVVRKEEKQELVPIDDGLNQEQIDNFFTRLKEKRD